MDSKHSRRTYSRHTRGIIEPIYAATADGKRRRPKADQSPKIQAPHLPAPPPPRVQVQSLIPARTQIKIVKEYREIQRRSAEPFRKKTTKPYRKETQQPEEYKAQRAVKEAEAIELSKSESKNFALSSLYQTNSRISRYCSAAAKLPPILLVDGYNVLFKWDRTIKYMEQGHLDIARDVLVEALSTYSHTNGVRVVVAFDGLNGPSTQVDETLLATGVTEVRFFIYFLLMCIRTSELIQL